MLKLGLTGMAGSGKSTAGRLLHERGACLLELDQVGRELTSPGGEAIEGLKRIFGDRFFIDGTSVLKREDLALHVFRDRKELEKLNELMFPFFRKKTFEWLQEQKRQKMVLAIVEGAIIIECGLDKMLDRLIFVQAPRQVLLERLVKLRKIDADVAESILESQEKMFRELPPGTVVLENDGDLQALENKVSFLFSSLLAECSGRGER